MKKITIALLALTLCFCMTACGRRNEGTQATPTTGAPTTMPTTATTTAPTILPTIETNIPDPSVDTSMPEMTDSTTGSTMDTGATDRK